MSEVTEQQLEDMEALFVQTAASMTSDRGTITLQGVSPSTLYFADRPQREVGHMLSTSLRGQLGSRGQQLRGQPPERRPVVRGAGRQASGGCGRGHPGSAPGRRRAQLQHQAPRRHRAGRHRAMCAVHRPARASFVTGLRRRDAPACASPGALRARRLAAVRGSNAIRENGWLLLRLHIPEEPAGSRRASRRRETWLHPRYGRPISLRPQPAVPAARETAGPGTRPSDRRPLPPLATAPRKARHMDPFGRRRSVGGRFVPRVEALPQAVAERCSCSPWPPSRSRRGC